MSDDENLSHLIDGKALLRRLETVLALRGWKAADWARQAGLGRTRVHNLMNRLKADPGIDIGIKLLAPLAVAAEVPLDWLLFGREHQDGPTSAAPVALPPDPKYPERTLVLAGAAVSGVRADVAAELLAVDVGDQDPGFRFWMSQLHAIEARCEARIPSSEAPKLPASPLLPKLAGSLKD